jgi:hypothetical protein
MRATVFAFLVVHLVVFQALGGDRWMLLARERGLEECSGYASTVWELDLSGDAVATRRAVLACSGWNATPLGDLSAGLLRQQIRGEGKNGYVTRLYRIDYEDWAVQQVWVGHRASLAFEFHGVVVVSAQDEQDGPERLIRWNSEEKRFVPLAFELSHIRALEPSGRYHAVRRWGGGPGYGIFDAVTMEFVADEHAGLIGSWIESRYSSAAFCPEFSILAAHVTIQPYQQITFERTRTTGLIYILDLESGTYHPQATLVDWYTGSGWSGPASDRVRFTPSGSLEYYSADGLRDPVEARRVRLERLGGLPPGSETIPGEAAPQEEGKKPGYDEVWQFVFAKGVQIEQPVAQMDSAWAFSEDYGRFVLVVQGIAKTSRWFVADLDADTIREFWLNAPLDQKMVLDIVMIPDEPDIRGVDAIVQPCHP